MEIVIIALSAFLVSMLTFFSGFGLGTILTPVFAIFFPIDLAIALTGVVHFFNNVFKTFLVGKNADKTVLIRFGIPAVIASLIGAWLLLRLSSLPSLFQYQINEHVYKVTPVKAIIAILLIIFAIVEIIPSQKKVEFNRNKLAVGGFLSGFFGGLSGLQGAIRSAFLVKSGMSKEAYIGSVVLISIFIDITRLSVYATKFLKSSLIDNLALLISAVLAAMTGAFIGNKLLKKITLNFIQKLVAVMLVIISLAIGSGLI
jgi:uncharacterized protein